MHSCVILPPSVVLKECSSNVVLKTLLGLVGILVPRVRYKNSFVIGCPSGSDGDANSSGWMVEKNFVKFVRHFINFSRCSKERSVLMLLDNHDSHLSIEALDLLKDNGVVGVSFPPHRSHKLQPRSVFGMGMPTCPGHGRPGSAPDIYVTRYSASQAPQIMSRGASPATSSYLPEADEIRETPLYH
ncbi:hypothetical protein NQ318_018960 [Aromia moschata]|uniref:DDE-1 domain-containing protein n=1 Tax=Aromia moschata TaxID=1265417 RepID=A0AAV8ZIQ7_9CUCU|nr:hypothetical protein NQ318_018960 [Aromia moschata]